MRFFTVLATTAALIVTGTADAAPRKKTPGADQTAGTAAKHKPARISKPATRPSNQGWPTSVNDGSFSYGVGPGGSMR